MSDVSDGPRRVAIACQGGGSHTAFTAGVLKRLLRRGALDGHRVVGLSGTSGGAVCALLAWRALLDGGERSGELAARLLDGFWRDNSATDPVERLANLWSLASSGLENFVATPAVSPYDNYLAAFGAREFRRMLERRVDFGAVRVQPEGEEPALLVGAVDVISGEFRAFNSRRDRITPDTILASAAIPTIFRSVPIEGGLYWDGLFSQNPPVRELTDLGPDEIWVVQINPRRYDHEPRTLAEIADRRNELSGNLSLHQELYFIEKIDRMLREGYLAPGEKYRQITVRVLELSRSRFSRFLGTASKLNRDPDFIAALMEHGESRAEEFLDALAFERAWLDRDADAVVDFFDEEAEIVASEAFPDRGRYRGKPEIGSFVREHLCRDVRLDLTRKQVARDGVSWSVRSLSEDGTSVRTEGVARATLARRKIKSLSLDGG